MARIIDIADAVADILRAYRLDRTFVVTRAYQPMLTLEDLQTTYVTVIPKSTAGTRVSRATMEDTVLIDVGIQQKLPADPTNDVEEVDKLLGLVDDLKDLLRTTALPESVAAQWMSEEHEPIYFPDHLQEDRLFTAVVTVTFRQYR
jgi:hypothetical protein